MTWESAAAMDRGHEVVAEGADIVDIGGVPAKLGREVSPAEEISRTAAFIAASAPYRPPLQAGPDTTAAAPTPAGLPWLPGGSP